MAIKAALSGFLALLVAMGIGRFAFTPQVPLMIGAGQLTLTGAGVVATCNYLGYLLGAFDAMRSANGLEKRLWIGLWGAVALTLLSAQTHSLLAHGLLRLLIGAASGWAMVLVAAWTNDRLVQLRRPALGAAVFAGPGAGILASGLLALVMHRLGVNVADAWLVYGVTALVLVAAISPHLPRGGELTRRGPRDAMPALTPALKNLVWSYSLAGFGYILPATFLAQMAAARFPGSETGHWVWPVFGAASMAGIGVGILTRHCLSAGKRLALTLWAQTIGVVLMIAMPGVGGLMTGALLTGGGFLSVVQLTLVCARRQAPDHMRYMAGLLTCGYALGQLAGPMLSSLASALTGRLEPALVAAAAALALAGALVWRQP
ncbi:YbfB/YjiJ family MFS transporter [Acerihabitans arboris]|uniref:YbfB/YjiJ family MFS transporter n=1 Tax=Acerihabitans arboris TaxID=2691583 RepID=A0A845SLL3_9GAMM|nr:YbfB/YjiJ family MFS transporter [Acerihabitans arboris]NDL65810.1 YbfB/YjiJ family MFS transporter [Acerihabitans arboris]